MGAPGIVVVWSAGESMTRVIRPPLHGEHVLRRDEFPRDDRVSTQHASLHAREDSLVLTDLGSKNGTFVDGDQVPSQAVLHERSVVRIGRTVCVAVLDAAAFEDPHRIPRDEAVPFVDIPGVIQETVRTYAARLEIHATVIEACLLAAWQTREQLVLEIADACYACTQARETTLRGRHLRPLRPRRPVVPFAVVFETIMKVPPPFEIPHPYQVLSTTKLGASTQETMIGSEVGDALIVQADLGGVEHAPLGWFQVGFWGHGVNSYSVYYGRVTERYRIYLRLPYGEGAYCNDPEAERARAVETLTKYTRLVETLPVRYVSLVDAQGTADYELHLHDGRILRPTEELYSLDSVDLVALATNLATS